MAGGFTQAEQQETLDQRFPTAAASDEIGYSVNGTSEWAGLARTAVGATGWNPATAATPSVKANKNTILSAGATTAGTVSHYAVFKGGGGAQRTDWDVLRDPGTGTATPRALALGDKLEFAAGKVEIKLD